MDKIHIFCITEWYVKHHDENYYGASATVCFPFSYSADSYQFMPVQRIYNQCAHANICVNISGRAEECVLTRFTRKSSGYKLKNCFLRGL